MWQAQGIWSGLLNSFQSQCFQECIFNFIQLLKIQFLFLDCQPDMHVAKRVKINVRSFKHRRLEVQVYEVYNPNGTPPCPDTAISPRVRSPTQTHVAMCSGTLENSIDILPSALLSDCKRTVWEDWL